MGSIRRIGEKKISQLRQHLKDPLYRNSYYIIANMVTNTAAGFIFWLFAARFYSDSAVGLSSAIISGMNLLVMMSILGFDIGIIAYLAREPEKNKMINSCLSIVGIASFILAIIFILGIDIWSPALLVLKEPRYIGLFILFTITISMARIQNNIFISFRNAKYSFIQSLMAISRIIILPLVIVFSVFGIFFSYGLGLIVAFIVGNILISRVYPKYKRKFRIDRKMIKNIFHFSFGNYIAEVFAILPALILPLMIIHLVSAEMTAYFYVGWMIASLLFTIPGAIVMSLFAEGAFEPDNLQTEVIKATKLIFIFLIPMIIGIFIFGDKLLLLFGSGYSENSLKMLYLLTLSGIPVAINALFITIFRVQKKVKAIIFIFAFTAIFMLITSYVLLTRIGLLGVGVGLLSAQGITALVVGISKIRKK